ncbi:MAG: signal peptidase I [Burkholderiales bacterium]|nr:signal peptidase I [Burkholderiales bacterium]
MSFQSLIGNFSLILFVLLVITGVIWCFDLFVWSKQRQQHADAVLAQCSQDQLEQEKLRESLLKQPAWIEYSGSFFPVIVLVFVLRSFLFEPFKIPSGSMLPTLFVGDFILVNKFIYGIRLPIIDKKVISVTEPQRGDVMVFRYPRDVSQNYIKRIIGVPGDVVSYKNKKLTVNGIESTYQPEIDFLSDGEDLTYSKQFSENLTGVQHRILIDENRSSVIDRGGRSDFPYSENCLYDDEGFTCKVPAAQYFMMGDNRDNSMDSRFWGFVPDSHVVGKAFFIWMNFSSPSRVGSFK